MDGRVIVPSVSVPYEITLLSNPVQREDLINYVSVPYEITLLSNSLEMYISKTEFQYLMKLHYSQTGKIKEREINQFQYLMKLHYSQTHSIRIEVSEVFQYLMKLHYSQTLFNEKT